MATSSAEQERERERERERVNTDQVILRNLRAQTFMMASATLKIVLIPGEE